MDIKAFNAITTTDHLGLDWLEYYGKHKVWHPGVDLNNGWGNDDVGQSIMCPVQGEVVYVSPESNWKNLYNGGFGNHTVIWHPSYQYYTHYVHCQRIFVSEGDQVSKNSEIALLGNSGTKYAHLHFEVWTKELGEIQKDHWRKYSFYPTNKPKSWIKKYYVSPYKLMEEIGSVPEKNYQDERNEAYQWLVEMGVLSDKTPPEQMLSEWRTDKLAVVLKRLFDKKGL